MAHQSGMIMCLKGLLEELARKCSDYKSAHNRKVFQESRNKVVKEEIFREFERNLNPSANVSPKSKLKARAGFMEEAKGSPKRAEISEKEKDSIRLEKRMIQQLINSDLEIIKQAQNKMIEISMLIRQFSVKSLEQRELTELSTRSREPLVVKDAESSVRNVRQANKELMEAKKYQSTWRKVLVFVYLFFIGSLFFLDYVNTTYY